jgi:WD40 repeat protein
MNPAPEDSARDRRLEEVLHGYLQAVDAGRPPDREALLQQHPDLAPELAAFFADQDEVARMAQDTAGPVAPAARGAEAPTVAPGEVAPPAPGTRLRYFGDYELLEEVARGGMGVVYRASQVSLKRLVALKMILAGALATPRDVARFRAEAEAAANLDHPHIVPIYEVGEHDGQQYYAMRFVEGTSLAGRPRSDARTEARLMAAVAAAVHHAHRRGILHRDLKPSNILVDPAGTPFVADFGLAKRVDTDRSLTEPGALVGTPRYMSPEQAAGRKDLTVAVDVYSLGVVLYERLTGRTPFTGETVLEVLRQVRETEPPRPSSLTPGLDRDLETICLKCLEKDAPKRYASAEALADDLERWLHGEPIAARPVGAIERGWRWCRRNPAVASLLVLTSLSLVLGAGVATFFAVRAGQRAAEAEESERRMRLAQAEEKAARGEAGHSSYINRITLANRAWEAGNIAFARQHLEATSPALRGWEYRFLARLVYRPEQTFVPPNGGVTAAVLSPDGKRIAGANRVWDALTGRELFALEEPGDRPVFSPDSKLLMTGGMKGVWVQDAQTGRVVFTVPEGRRAAFSPDGKRLATAGDNGVRVWDARTGRKVLFLTAGPTPVADVAYSPTGKQIVAVVDDKTVKVLDAVTGAEIRTLPTTSAGVSHWAISPDGKKIVLGYDQGEAGVWDVETGRLTASLQKHVGGVNNRVSPVAFSPDGKRVATTAFWTMLVRVSDAQTGRELFALDRFRLPVGCFAFSPDGQSLATGCEDGGITIWDGRTGREVRSLKGHTKGVRSLVFSSDGRRLVSASIDNTIQVWDVSGDQGVLSLRGHVDRIRSVRFSPDGRQVVSGGDDKAVTVWDARTGQKVLSLRGQAAGVLGAELTSDGTRLVTWGDDQRVRVWDARTGRLAFSIEVGTSVVALSADGRRIASASQNVVKVWDAQTGKQLASREVGALAVGLLAWSPDGKRLVHVDCDTRKEGPDFASWDWEGPTDQKPFAFRWSLDMAYCVAFSPDGRWLVAGGDAGTAKVWDVRTGTEAVSLLGHLGPVLSVAYSPDGTRIITGSHDQAVKVWDAKTGQELLTLPGHAGAVHSVAFSRDGRRIVSGGADRTVRVWDAGPVGWQPFSFKGHAGEITSLAFVLGGRQFVTASRDRTIKVWDPKTGREALSLEGHTDEVTTLAVSPDGRRIASGGKDGSVKVWDARTGREKLPLRGHTNGIRCIAFSADGSRIATASDQTIRVWDARRGKEALTLQGHQDTVTCMAFSPDGGRIVSGSWDHVIKVWDARTAKELWSFEGHEAEVNSVAFSPDGRRIVSAGADGLAKVWEVEGGRKVLTLDGHPRDAEFTPDGKHIVSTKGYPMEQWDAQTGKKVSAPGTRLELDYDWHTYRSPDGSFLASTRNNVIRLRPVPSSLDAVRAARLRCMAEPDPAWHEEQARKAAATGNWFAAAFHFLRLLEGIRAGS